MIDALVKQAITELKGSKLLLARIEELEAELDEWRSLAEAAIRDDASKNIYYAEIQAKLAKSVEIAAKHASDENPAGWAFIEIVKALQGDNNGNV